MKKIKRILSIMLIMALSAVSMPLHADAAVKINAAKKTIDVGKSVTLKVTGTKKKAKWESSNKSVATVTQKGKVTGKKEGTAIITAKVSKKTLRCVVTVKSDFSVEKATKNISVILNDTGNGIVAVLKNNNKLTVSVNAKLVYYKDKTMIDTKNDFNYAFESGKECVMLFGCPRDGSFNRVDYDDYKITLSVSKGSSNLICGVSGIKVNSDYGADNITAEIINNSGKKLSSIHVTCVFFDNNGNVIDAEAHYAGCEEKGSVDYVKFNFPYDENYETIQPSDYKIYIDNAYSYSWQS